MKSKSNVSQIVPPEIFVLFLQSQDLKTSKFVGKRQKRKIQQLILLNSIYHTRRKNPPKQLLIDLEYILGNLDDEYQKIFTETK